MCRDNHEKFIPVTSFYLSLVKWGLDSEETLSVCLAAVESRLDYKEYSDIVSLFVKGRQMHLSNKKLVERISELLVSEKSLRQVEKKLFR